MDNENQNPVENTDLNAGIDQEGVNNDHQAPDDNDDQVDYAAELAKVQAERDNYKQGLLNAKDKAKKGGSLDMEKLIEVLDQKLEEKISMLTTSIQATSLDSKLSQITDDSAKKELIKYHYEKSIVKTGNLDEDLENALLIADKKNIFKKDKELNLALRNRQSLPNSSMGGGNLGKPDVEDKFLNSEQMRELKKRGWDDEKIKRYKENLIKAKNK